MMLFFATLKAKFTWETRKSRFFDPRTRCRANNEFSASFATDSQQNLRMHLYEVRPRKGHRGVDLISDALPFGRLWYAEPSAASNAVDYAKRSRSHDAAIGLTMSHIDVDGFYASLYEFDYPILLDLVARNPVISISL
jgi:hypothetical protein